MNVITLKRFIMSMGMLSLSALVYADKVETLSNPWSGIYLGFNFGGIFNQANLHAHQLGFDNLPGVCDANTHFSSTYPGAELGYTLQLDSKWVVGLLGNYSYNLSRINRVACNCPFDAHISDRFTVQNTMQGSLLGRLGYALENHLLPYFAGGVSFANLKLNYNNEIANSYSQSNTQPGWRVGGGIEWLIAPNWSISSEYYYTDYNAFNMAIPVVYGLFDPNGNARVQMNANNIQASIKYWFK